MKSETTLEQNERLAQFTCRMEQNERGSVRKFYREQEKNFPKTSLEANILYMLAMKSTHAKVQQT